MRYLPDALRMLRNPKELLESYITELINLLVVENAQARDLAREALSAEAHPRLYPIILKGLKLYVANTADASSYANSCLVY
jgi:hypothetical protein